MDKTPTPHNSAKKGEVAETVLMPGDPLRAKYIAEAYLQDARCFNEVRGMYGYTGTYKGKRLSVMGHGMGIPSIAIYTYELFNFYDVKNIIRVGSAGALQDDVQLKDIVIGMGACTESAFADHYNLPGTFAPIADFGLLEKAVQKAREAGIPVKVGNLISGDMFYEDDPAASDGWRKMGVLAAEMEAAALYMNAARAEKKALVMCTIADHIYKDEHLSSMERQTGFNKMIEVALEVAVDIKKANPPLFVSGGFAYTENLFTKFPDTSILQVCCRGSSICSSNSLAAT